MKYKKLGSAGFEVSAVSVGTWGIGGSFWDATTKEESLRAIDTMLDQGVNLIDLRIRQSDPGRPGIRTRGNPGGRGHPSAA